MLRRLIILALLGAGFWWYWTHWRPTHNYKILSGQLDHVVNQELVRSGITDQDVLQQFHHERARLGMGWIETERRIQMDPRHVGALQDRLIREAAKMGCSVIK